MKIIKAKIIKVSVVMILTSVEFELLKTFISVFFNVILAELQLTGNGFAKAGLLHLKFLLKLHQAKTIFVFSKLQKNKKRNGFLRLIMTKLSTQEKFTPAFAKPMLCDVAISQ